MPLYYIMCYRRGGLFGDAVAPLRDKAGIVTFYTRKDAQAEVDRLHRRMLPTAGALIHYEVKKKKA